MEYLSSVNYSHLDTVNTIEEWTTSDIKVPCTGCVATGDAASLSTGSSGGLGSAAFGLLLQYSRIGMSRVDGKKKRGQYHGNVSTLDGTPQTCPL